MRFRRILGVTASAAALLAPGAPQSAAGRELLSDAEMADARGGVLVAGNVAFEFGAVVKTFEDGVLSLQTQVNWTPQGPQVQQTVGPSVTQLGQQIADQITQQVQQQVQTATALPSGQSTTTTGSPNTLANAPPAVQDAVAATAQTVQTAAQAGQTAAQTAQSASQSATQAAQQTAQSSVQNATQSTIQAPQQLAGPVSVTPSGQSAANNTQTVFVTSSGANIIQQVTQGQLLNVLLNTQSNHAFVQSTDITLMLKGFTGFQASVAQQVNGMRIADEIRAAMAAGGR